ncbi:hypothetical protein SCHPADRAFT_539968 [Schizopora paradoxa]|uniref:Uncharacterized protein n=1 Tax=Schizopora paradoxa TaxID=27342 RepID=A0A0H2RKM8_9AGAM|nr:hypothetical protein SCHPADRAFT_539968 [Schizopora paradoxa]
MRSVQQIQSLRKWLPPDSPRSKKAASQPREEEKSKEVRPATRPTWPSPEAGCIRASPRPLSPSIRRGENSAGSAEFSCLRPPIICLLRYGRLAFCHVPSSYAFNLAPRCLLARVSPLFSIAIVLELTVHLN